MKLATFYIFYVMYKCNEKNEKRNGFILQAPEISVQKTLQQRCTALHISSLQQTLILYIYIYILYIFKPILENLLHQTHSWCLSNYCNDKIYKKMPALSLKVSTDPKIITMFI